MFPDLLWSLEARASFGGIHPGTCNLLFGDGSVHSFPNTVNGTIPFNLSSVDDGEAVALP
jgi:prepilin-type processing-associated H-X9-DG protein